MKKNKKGSIKDIVNNVKAICENMFEEHGYREFIVCCSNKDNHILPQTWNYHDTELAYNHIISNSDFLIENNEQILVVPTGDKPIKVVFEEDLPINWEEEGSK